MLAPTRARVSSTGTATTAARPVMLATLDVPVAPDAARVAVDSAVESGQPLLVVNVVARPFLPAVHAGWDTPSEPEVEESLRAPAELAASLGVAAERLRVLSPHPIDALVELVQEREPGLLVLGADPNRLRKRFRAKVERRVRERTTCLVWPA